MKQQILALLIAKFAGVSGKILDRIATNMAKTATTEELATTAVEGVTIQSVMDNQADYRANEATVNAVSNYENKHGLKHGLKDGQTMTTGGESKNTEPNPNGNDDDTPAWAKTLLDSNKTLSDRMTAMEGAKVTDSRKQRFDAIIANLPEDQKNPYKRTDINSLSDEEFETLVTDVTTEVGTIEASEKAKGSVFTRPLGGGATSTKEPSSEELNAAVANLGLN